MSFDRPVNPYASPSGAFEPSGTRGPDRGGRQRGGSDEGRPALIGSELDSLGLDSLGLDSAGLDPLSADLGSSKSGPGPESLASSPLWLPVAQLPAETDGWLPSLAPDDELAPLPEPDRGSGRGVDALLGELPPTSYADDPPPLLALEATESTNVMPVHVDSEDDPLPGARGGAADADGYGVDREADRPATPDEDHALSTDVSLPHGSADDQGRRDDPLTSPDPAAAHPDAEHSVPAHADHDHPGPREPGASDPKPDRVEPARPGAAREAAQKVVQKVVQEVVQEVAEVREDPHPVGARPEAAPASGVQGAGRRPSARDEDGELEGWPGFDEQVRVQS